MYLDFLVQPIDLALGACDGDCKKRLPAAILPKAWTLAAMTRPYYFSQQVQPPRSTCRPNVQGLIRWDVTSACGRMWITLQWLRFIVTTSYSFPPDPLPSSFEVACACLQLACIFRGLCRERKAKPLEDAVGYSREAEPTERLKGRERNESTHKRQQNWKERLVPRYGP